MNSVYAKDNLLAWCVVPFDARRRGPAERAAMLRRLGIRALAYDWRDEHIASFDDELAALRDHDIRLAAFWLNGGFPSDAGAARQDRYYRAVLEFVERNDLRIEVWKHYQGAEFAGIADLAARCDAGASQLDTLAGLFNEVGCTFGLYNHGHWGGEPRFMVELVRRLAHRDVGIVYNFHHGHGHFDSMPGAFEAMRPHLLCVNLNGMTPGVAQVLPLGRGELDLDMLRLVRDSGYTGPVGILDHRPDTDAEESLRQNLDGLRGLLEEMGDPASTTYGALD